MYVVVYRLPKIICYNVQRKMLKMYVLHELCMNVHDVGWELGTFACPVVNVHVTTCWIASKLMFCCLLFCFVFFFFFF